jgi:hypothetical protein
LEIFCLTETFQNDVVDRFRLTRSLYNLVYWMRQEDDALEKLKPTLDVIYNNLSQHEALTSRKRSRKEFEEGDGAGQGSGSGVRQGNGAGDAREGNAAEDDNEMEDAPTGRKSNQEGRFSAEGYKVMKWTISNTVR